VPSPETTRTAQASLAAEEARRRLRANPRNAEAYRVLGRALRDLGEDAAANDAELAAIRCSADDPEINRAHQAMLANDLPTAEAILRSLLAAQPGDVVAIRMLAEIAIHFGHGRAAESLARRATELAPGFFYAHYTRAAALDLLGRSGEAVEELERIAGPEADYDPIVALTAASLSHVGENERAIELYRKLVERQPDNADIWISIANLEAIVGKQETAVASYRKAIEISPALGEAWWSLANLKTFRFSEEDVAAIETALRSNELRDDDRLRLEFALGKALEDRGEYEASFDHYRKGNLIRSFQTSYRPAETTALVEETEKLFTPDFLIEREGVGASSSEPIFIVGMPRAGSTLVEQILASHSLIEGTGELPDIIVLARELEEAAPGGMPEGWHNYPAILRDLSPDDFRRLGETYLHRTRIQRKTDRPYFTDKMPNNWLHIGLIRLILPNAKIIDARRHPLACGLSNFKQHYARGQEFSYDLAHFGAYYREYVRLVAHFDEVSPGTVHRVQHERLLANPEEEIRNLLDFLGLPFEDSCLSFHESKRAVRTASAEQVRRPIDPQKVDYWKNFEEWLDPLKQALGPAAERWPD
jgi:tetratricopeptide (TPR) repeat protein